VQVKWEMLRAHLVDRLPVTEEAAAHGFSRASPGAQQRTPAQRPRSAQPPHGGRSGLQPARQAGRQMRAKRLIVELDPPTERKLAVEAAVCPEAPRNIMTMIRMHTMHRELPQRSRPPA
jgi:hypothetical protein